MIIIRMPTVVLNYIRSNKQKPLPYEAVYNDITIMKFLDSNYAAKLEGSDLE
jgi:hypothetical protein